LRAIVLTESVRSFHVAGDAFDDGLTSEPPVGTDLARDARDLAGERVELVGPSC